jgi:hypothetical protein
LRSGGTLDAENKSEPNERKKMLDESSPEFYTQKNGPFAITTALLARMASVASEHGARTILLTLGGGVDNGELTARHMLPHEQLINAAMRSGFSDGVALSTILTSYQGTDLLFFPQDGHWTAAATRFVAPKVADLLARPIQQGDKSHTFPTDIVSR